MRQPIGFAHRGAPALLARENTLAAFRRALAAGAGGLESDVWLTADSVPVLHHDGVLGPPHRRRPIRELREAQLPTWVPSLADLYIACGADFDLSLDLKDPLSTTRQSAEAVISTARAAGAVGRLWLCGTLEAIRVWRSVDAEVRLVNSTSTREINSRGAVIGADLERYVCRAAASGAAVLNLRANEWERQMVPVIHSGGLLAFGWHAQSSRTLNRLLRFGLDGVYSDYLGRLVRVTGRAGTIIRARNSA